MGKRGAKNLERFWSLQLSLGWDHLHKLWPNKFTVSIPSPPWILCDDCNFNFKISFMWWVQFQDVMLWDFVSQELNFYEQSGYLSSFLCLPFWIEIHIRVSWFWVSISMCMYTLHITYRAIFNKWLSTWVNMSFL